ncbi:hypothetical protein AVEN_129013-1 [Araneus ventricosus]|uniref:Uncharacterized protein n=1 Tax=Araneus ventricosus TaxID=182803 RepID=A0A4Y2WD58_ARAVE|nr:hypothetical protein AVEN_129013-1 [Araneus ventricosus]
MNLCTKEIKSQQRIRNKILFETPGIARISWCGLFFSTFWADLKTLRIIRSHSSDITLRKRVSCLTASVQSTDRKPPATWSRTDTSDAQLE